MYKKMLLAFTVFSVAAVSQTTAVDFNQQAAGACPGGSVSEQEETLGIMRVEYAGSRIVLNVILKDQYKLQLFEGEVAGPQVWVRSMNRPASVLINFEADTLTMGSFSGKFDTTGIRMRTEFPERTSGLKEILIAIREKEGTEVPIKLKLVPTTPEEKAKINGGEQEG